MKILVTGGAGYIGSVLSHMLVDRGHEVHIVDNLSTGHKELVPAGVSFIRCSFDDPLVVDELREWDPDCVVHLAASALVSESQVCQEDYVENNVWALERFCKEMSGCIPLSLSQFIFASTCSVYGSGTPPFVEEDPVEPENVYAQTKLDGEKLLRKHFEGTTVCVTALRFFNVAGGDAENSLGEAHFPESHLIPNAIAAAENGTALTINGVDYGTPDGTAIRDYVHVKDVAGAIIRIVEGKSRRRFQVLNVGASDPQSVMQVVLAVEKEFGVKVDLDLGPRRGGDPPILFADITRIQKVYGWQPEHSGIDAIVGSARAWRQSQRFKAICIRKNGEGGNDS